MSNNADCRFVVMRTHALTPHPDKLIYWPIPGRGEFIRLCLEHAGASWTDTPGGVDEVLSYVNGSGEHRTATHTHLLTHHSRPRREPRSTCPADPERREEWRHTLANCRHPHVHSTQIGSRRRETTHAYSATRTHGARFQ